MQTLTKEAENFKEPELVITDDGTQARSPIGLLDAAPGEPSLNPEELQPGDIIAQRYKVLNIIGKGAMGCVYRVQQLALNKELALKTLNHISASDVNIRRFQNEAMATAKLEHPNLVRAVDYGWLGQQPYLVMDFVQGPTLAQHLKKVTTLPMETMLKIFTPICFALAYAHEQGVVHRDLKPSNIILSPNSDKQNPFVAKLVDFGIAKMETEEGLTKTGEVFGTPLYMSPEQCLGSKVDNRSDIYSLGCVLYEALTGAPPFRGQSALETMMQHRVEMQLPLKQAALGVEFPPALETILFKMLAKEPSQRYQSCLEVAQDLTLLQQGRSDLIAGSVSPTKRILSNKILIASAVISLTVVGFVVSLWPDSHKNQSMTTMPIEEIPNVEQTHLTSSNISLPDANEEMFSKIVGKPPSAMRIFDFGNQKLGTISHMRDIYGQTQESVPAVGRVSFQKDWPLLLEIPFPVVYRDPRLLTRFRADDLQGLKLSYSTASSMMDLQEQSVEGTLAFASHLKELKYLQLPSPVTTRAMRNLHLEDLTELDSLIIAGTEIDCAQLATFRKTLSHLCMLDVSSLRNVASLIKPLRGSTRMMFLTLDDTGLKDADLSDIGKIFNLKGLQLSHNGITDSGIPKLTKLYALRNLGLSDTRVTAACADQLATLPLLERVMFPERLKKDELVLKHRLPHCQIVFGN
jgi:serine/threonine protein kinase